MPKYRKIPIIIEAVQVVDLNSAQGLRKSPRTRDFEVYNALHDSWIQVNTGDWLNVTNLFDIYPIDKDYFAKHYEAIDNAANQT